MEKTNIGCLPMPVTWFNLLVKQSNPDKMHATWFNLLVKQSNPDKMHVTWFNIN
jgi:hypothetical protein